MHSDVKPLWQGQKDSLLASIAETEKQTALAARVSSWKQRIEQNLDEQDARPPFDIHEYGQRTLDKLSLEADVGNSLTFTDVVRGQEKHDVARTFSALLQLLISGRTGYDYKSVRRWTSQRKLGYSLQECDKIFVPVHKEIHWCLAVINKKEKKFQYLDSLGGIDRQVMRVLANYILDEVKDKNGEDIDVTSWKQEFVTDLPNQENGYDCGVFMIKYADFYSRDIGLCFKQEHMPYFRKRTAKEILGLNAT